MHGTPPPVIRLAEYSDVTVIVVAPPLSRSTIDLPRVLLSVRRGRCHSPAHSEKASACCRRRAQLPPVTTATIATQAGDTWGRYAAGEHSKTDDG